MRTPANRTVKQFLLDAVRRDDASTFRTILDAQPNGWPSYSQWSDYELLVKAVRQGCKRIAYLLLEKRARIFKRTRINNPLHEAAAKPGWVDFVKVLLDRGARVAEVNSKRDTAVHVAFAQGKCMEVLDLLLKTHMRNREENVASDGLSLLHIACTRPNLSVVKTMLNKAKKAVNVQVPLTSNSQYAGFTPLHFAVTFGQHGVVDLLLDEFNADVYVQDTNGSTPLHLAAERRDVAMIDRILGFEKRYEDRQNKFGLSHFASACAGSNETIVNEYLRLASWNSWSDPDSLVRSQVQHQENYPNAGYTPLHFAAQLGRYNTVKLLLEHGAQCCATTATNATPFALACKQDHLDVCELLIEYCEDASKEPSKKRKRVEIEGNEIVVRLSESLKRQKINCNRSGSVVTDESTLTSSSIVSSTLDCLNESIVIDPLTLCMNPLKVFQDDEGSFLKGSKFFDYYDDVDMQVDESSLGLKGNHLICGQGVWNFRLDVENDYSSIEVPKDIHFDFYEPLDNVVLDDIVFDAGFEVVCTEQSAVEDSLFVDVPKDVELNLEEPALKDCLSVKLSQDIELILVEPTVKDCISLDESKVVELNLEESAFKDCLSVNLSKDVELIFVEPAAKDGLRIEVSNDVEANFEEPALKDCISLDVSNVVELNLVEPVVNDCLSVDVSKDVELNLEEPLLQTIAEDSKNLEISSIDEEVQFDKLFEKFRREESSAENDDCDWSFVSAFDQSTVVDNRILVQEIEKKLVDVDSKIIHVSDEISNSSSESHILGEATESSTFSDNSNTSGYESDCSDKNIPEIIGIDCYSDKSARIESVELDSFENKVEEAVGTDCDSNMTACIESVELSSENKIEEAVRTDCDSSKSTLSSPEREVEVQFVEVDFYSMYLEFPEEMRAKYQDFEKDECDDEMFCESKITDSSNSSTTASFEFELTDANLKFNNFLDTSSVSQSRVSCLSPFQFSAAGKVQMVINSGTKPSFTVDFSCY